MKLDNKLNEVERQKRARRSRSRWKKLSRKSIFLRGKRSTKNLVRLCEENASEKPTIIIHTEDVDFRPYFPNSTVVSKSENKKSDFLVGTFFDELKDIEPSSYDVAICTGLLEHVPNPQLLIDNIRNLLKPGGKMIMSSSAVFSYHEGPHNYFHFTPFGMKHLLKEWSSIKTLKGSSQPFETIGILLQRILLQCDIFPPLRPLIELLCLVIPLFDKAVSDQFDSTWQYTDDHKIDSMMPSNVQVVAIK